MPQLDTLQRDIMFRQRVVWLTVRALNSEFRDDPWFKSAVNLASVANLQYQNPHYTVLNVGNDSVVPHAVLPKLPQLRAFECLANAARVIKLRHATVQKAQDASGVLLVELLEVFNSAFGQFNLPSHTAS